MKLQEKIKDKQEDVINEVGEHGQTICEQEKVKKNQKVSWVWKKVKRKTMPDNVPAPSASKAKRGRRRQVCQVQNVMEIVMENMTEIMTENLDEIVDEMTGIRRRM